MIKTIKMFFLPILIILFINVCGGPPKPSNEKNNEVISQEKTVDELIKDLNSEQPSTRAQAMIALSERNNKESIEIIRKLLKEDKNAAVRGSAALALGNLQDKESTKDIVALLKDKDITPDIVLDALTRMKDPSAADSIVPLLDSSNHAVRLLTVEALSAMDAKNSGELVLKQALKNLDDDKAKTYAMVLGRLEVKSSEPYLMELSGKLKPSPSLAAVYLALGRIKSVKSVPILAKAIGDSYDKGRENAVVALVDIQDKSALPLMFSYLENQDKSIRLAAAEVIVQIPSPDSGPKALKLLESGNKNSIGATGYVIGRLKYEAGRKAVEKVLSSAGTPEREELAKALGWIGNKESVPMLIKVLEEKTGEGRYGAAWSLGIIRDERAIEPLIKASNDADRRLSTMAIESLGQFKGDRVLKALDKKLESSEEVAPFVIGSISSIPGDEARKLLEKYALNKNPVVHRVAIQELGKRKDKKSVPVLIDALNLDILESRKLIYQALSTITGKSFYTKNEWLEWYKDNR
ncbi:MAG: HEAT repeat domain-containing protein [Leptospiraceae bacterium]|nr:HEAT repeat domain-containing protein [Leptospiraceae bacterium]MCP5495259.1 HEAT repeat domain-containing protein [Leptospiraceae bacterium]